MPNPHSRQLLPGHTEEVLEVTSVHLATGWFKSKVQLFTNEQAMLGPALPVPCRAAVGAVMQSSAVFLTGAVFFFIF